MTKHKKPVISIVAIINLPIEKVWETWTEAQHICKWNYASPEWHTPRAENDLRVGGRFTWRMEAKDGSMGFDFWGDYTQIEYLEKIEATLGDGRSLVVEFTDLDGKTKMREIFEAEETNPVELQKQGWQAILNNFKAYAESIF